MQMLGDLNICSGDRDWITTESISHSHVRFKVWLALFPSFTADTDVSTRATAKLGDIVATNSCASKAAFVRITRHELSCVLARVTLVCMSVFRRCGVSEQNYSN